MLHSTLIYHIGLLQSFVQCMEVVKAKLSPEELSKLHSGGRDIRRHLIDTGISAAFPQISPINLCQHIILAFKFNLGAKYLSNAISP